MSSETLARAARYVARRGAALDRLHVETLLRARPPDALLKALAERQREDGAVPDWRDAADAAEDARASAAADDDAAVYASADAAARAPMDAMASAGASSAEAVACAPDLAGFADADARGTLRALGVLDGLGLFDHPLPERAVNWLAARQQADGGFGDAALDEDARIAATGAAAGLLSKSPFARASWLHAAEQFLAARWDVARVQGGNYAAIFAYTHALVHCASEIADEVLQWCGRELERGFRSGAFDAVAVAQVFCRARARALPGTALTPEEITHALEAAQRADGAFRSRALAPLDATLCAVEALQRLGTPR